MTELKKVIQGLREIKVPGCRKTKNGVELFGKVPHVGKEAWFHEVFPRLTDSEISSLETALSRPLPQSYNDFLRVANGLILFSDNISFNGLKEGLEDRAGTEDIRKPYNLITRNRLERPLNSKNEFFFIGSYSEDGSLLFIDEKTDEVRRCSRENCVPVLNEWPNFETMLKVEVERIASLFDDAGRLKNPNASLLP